MGLSVQNSVLNEDFNYGYPYDKVVGDSAVEFEYSGEALTPWGHFKSSSYARKQFTLHYQNHRLQPKNYDYGIHGGSHSSNYFYMLWPLMQWDQFQVLTLKVNMTAPAVLSYDKGFDGYVKDEFYCLVNGRIMHMHTSTAGHGWTTYSTNIPRGNVTIQWALKTARYVPPRTRGGRTVSSKPPNLPRYLRMTNININFWVQDVLDAPHSYAKMLANGSSLTGTGHIAASSGPMTMQGYASLYDGILSGDIFMTATTTFYTDWNTERDMGQAVLGGTSDLTVNASIEQNHEAYDGGCEMGTSGDITVKVPIDYRQTIADRTKPLKVTTFDYAGAPIVSKGQLIVPAYSSVQSTILASGNTYTYADAVEPTSAAHVYPVTEQYRWLATSIPGADDSQVTQWNELHSTSNPIWYSYGDYRPTVHPHEHFHTESLNVVTYSRVLHFWWQHVQHMWVNLGTYPSSPHYTWQFVGLIHPMDKHHWQYIFDYGQQPPDYTSDVDQDRTKFFAEGLNSQRSAFAIWPGGFGTWDAANAKNVIVKGGVMTTRPMVITVVFGDNSSTGNGGITVYTEGYKFSHKTSINVPVTVNPHFVLGRWQGVISREWSSHMSLMEVAFWDRALTADEVKQNSDWHASVYHFNKYK